jgi:phage shock protein PspC (stress-responsive transcriptional regulator)
LKKEEPMKKTLSVNLSGSVYHIDEDAYQLLMDYLQDVKKNLTESSAEEVLNDIEQRISELFTQWMQGKREVIIVSDVERVIGILGRPEQFVNEDDEAPSDSSNASQATTGNSEERTQAPIRRLYRDTDNAFLGGVCAGLAAYLNVSIPLMRALVFILMWFYGVGFLFYIAAWIIMPEARTAAQRLEMRGEDVTIENIEKKVREEASRVKDRVDGYVRSNRFHENVHSTSNTLVTIIRIVVKVFLAIIGGAIGLAGFFVLLSLIFALAVLWTGNIHIMQMWPNEFQPLYHLMQNPSTATWMALGLILVVAIPFIALFRLLFSHSFNFKPAPRWEIWVGLIFWFIGVGLCFFAGLNMLSFYNGCGYWM